MSTNPRERRIGELTLRDYRYGSGHFVPCHLHELAYLSVVLDGGFDERGDGAPLACTEGTVGFYPEGESHTNRFHRGGGHVLRVDMAPAWLDRVRERSTAFARTVEFRGAEARALGRRLHRAFASADPGSGLAAEGLTLELLGLAQGAAAGETRAPAWLVRIEDLLRSRFRESIPLTEMAAEVGIHPSHLARVFRAHHGCTIGAFVRQLRVDEACRRLRRSDTDLAALAGELGFVDQSHLGRVFKQRTGLSPAEYRRRS
jgi:AraC-like DNA-binding protein